MYLVCCVDKAQCVEERIIQKRLRLIDTGVLANYLLRSTFFANQKGIFKNVYELSVINWLTK